MTRWPGEPRPTKPLAGQGEPVLYLDFDGVLHNEDVLWHPSRCFECLSQRLHGLRIRRALHYSLGEPRGQAVASCDALAIG
jgi:hypothetical protein